MFFLLFAFSKLNANNVIEPFIDTNDSLQNADTVLITTKYFNEEKIYSIDSICKEREQILRKMPTPYFIRPVGEYIDLGEDYSYTKYDSINQLIDKRGYKEKIGPDTLGDIIREIYCYKYGGYFRVKYSNYKTNELLMLVITEYQTIDYTITYFSNNEIIKIESYSTFKPLPQDSKPVSHTSSYYANRNLLGAKITNSNNCKVKFIYNYDKYCSIAFDECMDTMFAYTISKQMTSKKTIKKEEKKHWVKLN